MRRFETIKDKKIYEEKTTTPFVDDFGWILTSFNDCDNICDPK